MGRVKVAVIAVGACVSALLLYSLVTDSEDQSIALEETVAEPASSGADSLPNSSATTLAGLPEPTAESTSTSVSQVNEDSSIATNLSAEGWIVPNPGVNVGSRFDPDQYRDFPKANDGPFGVAITSEFLEKHEGADWLSEENGTPVISGALIDGRCLNIRTALVLRDSLVDCPTRIQNDTWGYAGEVGDTPAVNIMSEGVTIEYNTITCSGFDEDICGRNIRLGGRDSLIQYNDLSLARGAIQLFHDATVQYNYMHSFAFGLDPNRIGNKVGSSNLADEITHNNAVNNQGYENIKVIGNYIDATYGRVSKEPTKNLNPHFRALAYDGGVVEVGDPINGFTFTNYLSEERTGAGYMISKNYVSESGRPFRCNSSSKPNTATCVQDFSDNSFGDNQFDLFKVSPLLEDPDGKGLLSGRCNYTVDNSGSKNYLGEDIFGPRFTHETDSC